MSTTQHKVSRAAGAVGSMTLVSRAFGFVRDVLIAMQFGATPAADAFFVAFRIPNIQRRVLAEGAVSSAFIPVFSEYRETGQEGEQWALAGSLFNILIVLLFVSSLALIVFAPWIVGLFAPGFIDEPDKFDLTVRLTQWMAPFLLFIGLTAFSSGILNSYKQFALPAAAPAITNICIILAVLFWSPMLDTPVMALAFAVCIGGFLQLIVQAPPTFAAGFHFTPFKSWRHPGVTRIGKLMVPVMLGLAVYEINLLVDTLLASLLSGGSISYLYYANRLVQLPLGVFAVALGVALLPTLSAQAARKQFGELRDTLNFGIRLILFITIPATVGLILCRVPIVNTLWERGEFTAATTEGTAFALLFYALGLCGFAGSKVVITAFYSMQDTRTPMKIGIWSMVLNIFLNVILMGPLQHGGLALATSLASVFNAVVLLFILKKRLGRLGGRKIFKVTVKISAAAGVMGLAVYFFNQAAFDPAGPTLFKIISVLGAIGLGVLVFSVVARLMKLEELQAVLKIRSKTADAGG